MSGTSIRNILVSTMSGLATLALILCVLYYAKTGLGSIFFVSFAYILGIGYVLHLHADFERRTNKHKMFAGIRMDYRLTAFQAFYCGVLAPLVLVVSVMPHAKE